MVHRASGQAHKAMDVRSLSNSSRRCAPHHFRTVVFDYRTHGDSFLRIPTEQVALELVGEGTECLLRKLVAHPVVSTEGQRHHDVVLPAKEPVGGLHL